MNPTNNSLHGTEPFSTIWLSLSWFRNPAVLCEIQSFTNIFPKFCLSDESSPYLTHSSFNINLLLSSYRRLGFSSDILSSVFPRTISYSFISLTRAIFLASFIVLDLITLIISDAEYKLWNSSLCNFLHHPVTFPLHIHIFSSAPYSYHPQSMYW
jgi:hypothetical protein